MNRIHFLRAAWCDIILLESGKHYALIDTGVAEAAGRISGYLASLGISCLDWILITHFHRDHYGSLPILLEQFQVKKVYIKKFSGLVISDGAGHAATREFNESELKNCEDLCTQIQAVSSLTVIDETVSGIQLEDFNFRIFGNTDAIRTMYTDPASPYYHQICFGENTNSVALYAEVNGTSVYLGADAVNEPLEDPRFDRQNAQYAREIGKAVDLYKVPHHGCGAIYDKEILGIFRPRFSVVTNWNLTWNRNFSRNRDLLHAARPDGQILCTDRCSLIFTLGKNGHLCMEETGPLPSVSAEEVPPEDLAEFREMRLRHLGEDGILSGDGKEPVCFSCGACRQKLECLPWEEEKLRRVWFVREDKRIGAALCSTDDSEKNRWEILDFWVFPSFRGKGAGHFCFEALEAFCREAGAESFALHCEKPAVIRFWRAFGFQQPKPEEPFLLSPDACREG